MNKHGILLVCVLLVLVVLAGFWNRQTVKEALGEPSTGIAPAETAAMAQITEPASTENAPSEQTRISRTYPDAGIVIDAICPVSQPQQLPALTARISRGYFDEILTEFLNRYPQAQELRQDDWWAEGPDGQVLASLAMYAQERYQVYFSDYKLDVNGSFGSSDGGENRYGYFTAETLSDPDAKPFPLEQALKNAIQSLSAYTDFDLVPYRAVAETDSATGRSWYRLGLQLSYQGIPVSIASENGSVDVDVGISSQGIGHISGSLLFSNIEEEESCPVLELEEILAVFENQGYASLVAFGQQEGDRYEVYRIQPEYFARLQQATEEWAFCPVWSFYYTYYSAGSPDSGFDNIVMFYADTGALCCAD